MLQTNMIFYCFAKNSQTLAKSNFVLKPGGLWQVTLGLYIIMKILLTLFILLFPSSLFSEEISDFQIEGMSIEDSALDFFSLQELTDNIAETSYVKKGRPYISKPPGAWNKKWKKKAPEQMKAPIGKKHNM